MSSVKQNSVTPSQRAKRENDNATDDRRPMTDAAPRADLTGFGNLSGPERERADAEHITNSFFVRGVFSHAPKIPCVGCRLFVARVRAPVQASA